MIRNPVETFSPWEGKIIEWHSMERKEIKNGKGIYDFRCLKNSGGGEPCAAILGGRTGIVHSKK
jgi:hypothetical protein